MNDYQKFHVFKLICGDLNLNEDNVEVQEGIAIVEDLVTDTSISERIGEILKELSSEDISEQFLNSFKKHVSENEINEARKLVSTIKTTGKDAKARASKADVMRELNKNKQYIAARNKLMGIATREVKKIAREKGINPSLIKLNKVTIK